ncbi:MAG: murein biosynthesis integral membrane protein MurJ [Acidobacteria bacterium]|nr:MAG: murein biosynthesis integral membrane protein MurJ [Acidobacteriota bacterium]PYS58311.1 MAG: murein biosynthesis integral membrane protein MurJ [Acidobacteriota bacterium]
MVGAGILISRIIGVVRQRVFAYYLGTSDAAGAFSAAFRIPNFLQNVFGEGALSASFIPVYANLLARGDKKEASRVADAVLTMLALTTSIIVLVGVLTTPFFVGLFAYSFSEAARELTIELVRILFPGAGLLVLSAWCLGVLNSHRRFFLSYTAPVVWNLAIIATLVLFGNRKDQFHLATFTAWGSVVGSALQFGVQLPTILKLIGRLRPVLDIASENVRTVLRNFFPVFMSRGVVQISAFVDAMLAGLISEQAVAALMYAQSLYTLPVSLFGMSISAAELPAMSSALGTTTQIADQLRHRLSEGLSRIAFFIVPSVMAMMAFGDVMTGALYQTGKFGRADSKYVWGILAGSTIGLLASTLGRLYASTFYALHDTRTPLRYAVIRVLLTTCLGYLCAIPLPRLIGLDPKWGAAGLTASAGVAGWIEFALLRRSLNNRIGHTGLSLGYVSKLWLAAAVGAGFGWAIKLAIGVPHPVIVAALVLVPYGLVYFAISSALKVPEANAVVGRVLGFVGIRTR